MNSQRLVQRFLAYVTCSSESCFERQFCELIEKELLRLGFAVTRDEAAGRACGSDGFNIYGFLPGKQSEDGTLFCAHLDTVGPGVGIVPVIEDGVIRSSGNTILGADDKSGIAAVLEAVESLLEAGEQPEHPVEVLFTLCEEKGLKGAFAADFSMIKSKQGIVLDTGGDIGVMNRRSPAMLRIHVTVQGKAAHAGIAFNEGVHALQSAAKTVAELKLGYTDADSVRNISNFLAPGATNVVADKAEFDMEIRCFNPKDLDVHLQELKDKLAESDALYGTTHELDVDVHDSYFNVDEDDPFLLAAVERFAEMGITAQPRSTYGGSDVAVLNAHGIKSLNFSTGMRDAHAVTEHIHIADMEKICMFIEKTLRI